MEGQISDAILDELVADAAARPVPELTERSIRLAMLPGKADVVVGMRRSGKTYLLLQHLRALLAAGVSRAQTLHVSFEDERLQPMTTADLSRLMDAFYRSDPKARAGEIWLLFDEIQNVPGWERFVRRLLDEGRARFVLTGSSAKLLSKEIATSLRGRSIATEVLPFSFEEFVRHSGRELPVRWPPPAPKRAELEQALAGYLDVGGFPEVQRLDDETRARVLQEYVDVVLFRDVVERHHLSNTVALRQLVRRLLRSPAGKFSVHRVHGDMRSQGVEIGKESVHEMLAHLEDAYLLFTVAIDATSERRRASNPRKVYLVDPALARAVTVRGDVDVGHRLENLVYLELRRRGGEIAYHVTDSGREIDFVVERRDRDAELVQVTTSLRDPKTRAREVDALEEALRAGRAPSGTIVTLHEMENLNLGDRPVRVVPAWRWLAERG